MSNQMWRRPRQAAKNNVIQSLTLLMATAVAVLFEFRVLGHVSNYVMIWPTSGVALGLLLTFHRSTMRDRAQAMLFVMAGSVGGCVVAGMPITLACMISLLTTFDVWTGAALLSSSVRTFEDLKHRSTVDRLGAVAVIVPLLSSAIGCVPVCLFLHEPLLRTFAMSAMANSLGIALFLPAILLFAKGEHRRFKRWKPHLMSGALAFTFFITVSVLVFLQSSRPLLFVIVPPLVALVMVLGLEGAVLAAPLLSVIGWVATAHGHGPLWLLRSAQPEDRLVVLQAFIWTCVATALPVGALLDERRRAERETNTAQAIYKVLLQNSGDMIVLSSLQGSERYVSPAVERLTGWKPEEFLAMDRSTTIHPEDQPLARTVLQSLAGGKQEHRLCYRMLRKDGGWFWVEAEIRAYSNSPDNQVDGYVGTIRDISSFKQSEQRWQVERESLALEKRRLDELANVDPLTALLNRRGFEDRMRLAERVNAEHLSIMMIDVDNFKLYNDTYGHHGGDECLRQLAAVFKATLKRQSDAAARLGGEEFALLLPGTDEDGAVRMAELLLAGLRKLKLEHRASPHKQVTVSIGVASRCGMAQLNMAQLMQRADIALYRSKQSGKDRTTVFAESMVFVESVA